MQFQATAVEAYEDEGLGVITVCFDNGAEDYVQFQGASEGFEDDYYDNGFVYLEIRDQFYSGYDCFSSVVITRNSLLIQGINDKRMLEIAGEVNVRFEIDDNRFHGVVDSLRKAFRDCPEKLKIEAEHPDSTDP